jgi:hypothetical protein
MANAPIRLPTAPGVTAIIESSAAVNQRNRAIERANKITSKSLKVSQGPWGTVIEQIPFALSSGSNMVINNSGADVVPYGVLGVYGAPSSAWPTGSGTPSGTLLLNSIGSVVTQDYCGSFAICPSGIKNGATGPCILSGPTWAYVYISQVGDRWCDVCDGTSTYLLSRSSGSTKILAAATGSTGAQWCQVVIGEDCPFPAKITGSSIIGSNRAWTYAFSEVILTAAGQGNWSTLTNGRSGTTSSKSAYNGIEDMNGASGLFGNGTNSSNFPSGGSVALQPIPSGAIVWIKKVVTGSSVTYQLAYENSNDGSCT